MPQWQRFLDRLYSPISYWLDWPATYYLLYFAFYSFLIFVYAGIWYEMDIKQVELMKACQTSDREEWIIMLFYMFYILLCWSFERSLPEPYLKCIAPWHCVPFNTFLLTKNISNDHKLDAWLLGSISKSWQIPEYVHVY